VTAIGPVPAPGIAAGEALITRLGGVGAAPAAGAAEPGFASILTQGMRHVDAKVAEANGLVRQFAVDDSIPLHQVTYALEEARLAVELAMQVRTRLVESYRELMNMQL
jgi:flagellar hook-basal body complex protein FliE